MRKVIIPILIVVVVLGVGYAVYQYIASQNGAAVNQLGGSGTIEADQIAVTPQTQGRILAAPAEEGVSVKRGQVLYRLDPSIPALQVQQAKAGVRAAQANYKNVRNDSGSTSADKAAAKAQVDQAKVALRMAQVQLGYAVVRSPLTGVLTQIAQNVGENAVPGNTLAILSTPASLTVTIYVPENQIGLVKVGQTGTLTTDSTTKTYHGRVVFIATNAEFTPASIETKDQRVKLVYQVKLDITDADANLKPGMPADVVLQ